MTNSNRALHEIEHGKWLASRDAEETWGWGSPAGQRRAEKRANNIIKAANLKPGMDVLELGCGTGLFTQVFAKTGANLSANDISPELIDLAKKNNPDVNFLVGRFEDLSETKQFDAIVGSSVLHHLDIDASLTKARKLLRPGGRLAFAEPNLLNPQVAAERSFLRPLFHYVSPDEAAFVRWSLAKQLARHGFVKIKITPFDWLHPAVPSSLINPVEVIGRLLEKMPLVREFAGSVLISCENPA